MRSLNSSVLFHLIPVIMVEESTDRSADDFFEENALSPQRNISNRRKNRKEADDNLSNDSSAPSGQTTSSSNLIKNVQVETQTGYKLKTTQNTSLASDINADSSLQSTTVASNINTNSLLESKTGATDVSTTLLPESINQLSVEPNHKTTEEGIEKEEKEPIGRHENKEKASPPKEDNQTSTSPLLNENDDQSKILKNEDESDESKDKKGDGKKGKKSSRRKELLEYDLRDMYPEMQLLINKRRKDWDFNDPAIIRAVWFETKTNALYEWKTKFAKVKKRSAPQIPVQLNYATQLRNEFRDQIKEKEQQEIVGIEIGRDAPSYESIDLATTSTTQMRYKLVRNNPPIPEYFIRHYARYKKPPFLQHTLFGKQCKFD